MLQKKPPAEARTIFEKSQEAQRAYSLPRDEESFQDYLPDPELLRRKPLELPEISELDLTRHFSALARRNMGIDSNFYPLGSCTMKLNPRVNEWAASLPGFTRVHPLSPDEEAQGSLEVLYKMTRMLCEVCGFSDGSLVPNAGAQGEFAGIQMIAAYHAKHGETQRTEMLIPDNAHGTNPATAVMAGFTCVSIPSNENGDMDLDALRAAVSDRTAGLMLTNPNTLGLFSPVIGEIAAIIHEAGGLLFYDGANLNAILNVARPGDMGFDVMHINVHKTFSTPHGGGGPGAGPVLCNERLQEFLPVPRVIKDGDMYRTDWNAANAIGHIASFRGNFGICLRAYLYLILHGHYGLRRIAEIAVLNANYLKEGLKDIFTVPFPQPCMHEFVVQADRFMDKGVRALDIAKRLLDYGIHAPTVYFPLIIKECMLIEPAESESKDTLDRFLEVLRLVAKEAEEDPEFVKGAPYTQTCSRLDEVRAVRQPILKHVAV